ncbi:carboxypeptidase-like regulatory domain-containing protein, partial [Roseisolibacter sp. H3M3-2]|uniref:carboxypeptidase-like regulatory domain-containing protein n=1 Tax=Roseisolibacter sp. H3M3-2 TaxID=3031323 RepID=UPI0023DA0AB5
RGLNSLAHRTTWLRSDLVRGAALRGALADGAVAALADATTGKAITAPLRQELTLERCQLAPRAAAVPAGATLNVKGRDPLSLRLRAVGWPGGATRATWRLTDAGQVVPDDRVLAEAGAVEVRGESLPWVRAWLLVFDHPYYATTDAAGTFALDSVPPGRYTLVAWHPRAGRVEQEVTVTAGQTVSAELVLAR